MGEVLVPAADRYWGVQTQRSLENFCIGEEKMPLPILRAFALVKKACPPVRHRPLVSPRKARARAQGDDLCIRALGEGERRSRGSRACED